MERLTLGAMQFTAVVLMTLLTFKLLVPHKRSQEMPVATTARRLMATATAILAVHFLLQLSLDLRAMGALCYLTMQTYYSWRHTTGLRTMHRMLNDYYDSNTDGMLRWMQLSIVGLMLLALMVPFIIFKEQQGMTPTQYQEQQGNKQ